MIINWRLHQIPEYSWLKPEIYSLYLTFRILNFATISLKPLYSEIGVLTVCTYLYIPIFWFVFVFFVILH